MALTAYSQMEKLADDMDKKVDPAEATSKMSLLTKRIKSEEDDFNREELPLKYATMVFKLLRDKRMEIENGR